MQRRGSLALRRFGTGVPLTFTIYHTLIAIAGVAVTAIGLVTLKKSE
jgi:hypothetical protein